MEDYFSAFQSRVVDTKILQQEKRSIATVHFGAIAIECLLKTIVVDRYGLNEWKTENNNAKHGIKNPGHDLLRAFNQVPELRTRLSQSKYLMEFINLLQQPSLDYIDMRYVSEDLSDEFMEQWENAYVRVSHWLLNQMKTLPRPRRKGND